MRDFIVLHFEMVIEETKFFDVTKTLGYQSFIKSTSTSKNSVWIIILEQKSLFLGKNLVLRNWVLAVFKSLFLKRLSKRHLCSHYKKIKSKGLQNWHAHRKSN